MGIVDFFLGGNIRVAAKSTADIFNEGFDSFGDYDAAYRYTFIFRFNTIVRYAKNDRDFWVVDLFRKENIQNCTDITIANLNTGAAPKNVYFDQTYADFHQDTIANLRKFGLPEKFISGQNGALVSHIIQFMQKNERIPSEVHKNLITNA